MSNSLTLDVTDSTGATPLIPALNLRDEIIIRCVGADVFWTVNDTAVAGVGSFIEDGGSLILTGKKANAAFHAVCYSSQTSKLYTQLD